MSAFMYQSYLRASDQLHHVYLERIATGGVQRPDSLRR